jgi:hypothetical protein
MASPWTSLTHSVSIYPRSIAVISAAAAAGEWVSMCGGQSNSIDQSNYTWYQSILQLGISARLLSTSQPPNQSINQLVINPLGVDARFDDLNSILMHTQHNGWPIDSNYTRRPRPISSVLWDSGLRTRGDCRPQKVLKSVWKLMWQKQKLKFLSRFIL